MDQNLDSILEQFYLVVAKGLKHKHYQRTLDKRKEYMALVAGEGLDDKLRQYVRRESKELFQQRVDLTEHIVTAVSKSLLDPFYKVPRSNSARRVLRYTGTQSETKVGEIEGLLAKFWGAQSWDDFLATRFIELNSVDPNSFVAFDFKDFDPDVELVTPYPYEISSSMAVYYKKDNRILEYLIAKDSHKYKIRQDINTPDGSDFKNLKDHDKIYAKGHKYTLYAKNQTFQLLQVHESEATGLAALKEGEPETIGKDPRTFIKLGEAYYEFKAFLPHNVGEVPVIQVGYLRDLATGGETYLSPIAPAVPYLNKSIKTNSELDLVATLLAFPQPVMYSEKCKAVNCYEGHDTVTNAACTSCAGTGKKATAPSAQDAIVLTLPDSKEEMLPLDQLIKYVSPPVEIAKWQEDYIEKLIFNAKRIMFNSDVFDRKQIADTATGKTIDMQNVYDTLHPFAVKFGKTWTAGVEIIATLADRGDKLVASYTFGKDFKLKTLDSLILDMKNASDIGSPELVQHLNRDIAQIIFSEKPLELQRYQLKEVHSPFSGKNDAEVMLLLASGLVTMRDKVLHANFSRIFTELEIEHAKAKKDFYKLNRTIQRELIYKKVDEIIAELDAVNPVPEIAI